MEWTGFRKRIRLEKTRTPRTTVMKQQKWVFCIFIPDNDVIVFSYTQKPRYFIDSSGTAYGSL